METESTTEKPTFESVWALIEKNAKRSEENAKRSEEAFKRHDIEMEEIREFQRETALSIKETGRIVKRNGKQMGELHQRFGQLAEHLVAPGIARCFNELGFHFDGVAPRGYRILDEQSRVKTEIDVLLENREYIIAVEVKARPVMKDVEHHIRRLEILRESRDKKNDERRIRGAIAGAIFEKEIKGLAVEAGFYVLEQSGDTIRIDIPQGFKPREW